MSLSAQKRERLPQAPRAPLPELAEFLAPLRVHFTQGPSAETLRQYLTGCSVTVVPGFLIVQCP
jgi:hypothetical protein